jgi:hypothetical protein
MYRKPGTSGTLRHGAHRKPATNHVAKMNRSVLYGLAMITTTTVIVSLILWPWNEALLCINAYGKVCLFTNADLKVAGGCNVFTIFLYLYLCNTGAMIVRVHMARALFALNYHTFIRCAPKYITHNRKKSVAFHKPSFTKLANAQQNYMQISYTEFHQNRAIN